MEKTKDLINERKKKDDIKSDNREDLPIVNK